MVKIMVVLTCKEMGITEEEAQEIEFIMNEDFEEVDALDVEAGEVNEIYTFKSKEYGLPKNILHPATFEKDVQTIITYSEIIRMERQIEKLTKNLAKCDDAEKAEEIKADILLNQNLLSNYKSVVKNVPVLAHFIYKKFEIACAWAMMGSLPGLALHNATSVVTTISDYFKSDFDTDKDHSDKKRIVKNAINEFLNYYLATGYEENDEEKKKKFHVSINDEQLKHIVSQCAELYGWNANGLAKKDRSKGKGKMSNLEKDVTLYMLRLVLFDKFDFGATGKDIDIEV